MAKNILLGILCWNHWEIADRCLRSVLMHTNMENVSLLILNNGSDDKDTIDWLKGCHEGGIDVLHLDANYGIVGGMRKGFEYAFTDDAIEYVCWLNCDTLVTPGWLDRLIDTIKLNNDLIAVAPKDNNDYVCYQHFNIPDEYKPENKGVGLYGKDDNLQKYIAEEFYAKRKHPTYKMVECIDPPAALWRKAYVKEMGNFDKELDFGYGVLEMFIRAKRQKGYQIAYCLSSFIYHYAHGGAGKYEGFKKKFNYEFNVFVAKKISLIKSRHGVNMAIFGDIGQSNKNTINETEKGLVAL